MAKILAVTSLPDPHVDMVRDHAVQDIEVLDPATLLEDSGLTYTYNDGLFVVTYNNKDYSEVKSVWYRKPVIPSQEQLGIEGEFAEYAHKSYREHIKALYGLLRDRLWVSDYWNIMKANNKLFQIEVAHKLGFFVPQTVVTNSEKDAINFIRQAGTAVVKPLTPAIVDIGEETYAFYTTLVRAGQIPELDFSGLSVSPCIFQQAIDKRLDIRATVVDNQVFTCEIEQVGEMAGEIDWRTDIMVGEGLIYRKHAMPRELEDKCVQMTKQMGLKFGAIEFVIDQQGKYWFMEINPNGQWGFVELETGLPIAKAIAELLESN